MRELFATNTRIYKIPLRLFISEKKTRPCVVISPNEMNKYLRTIIVAPMTTNSKKYPTRIEVKHDRKIGWIVIDQIRTIDKK